MASIVKTETSKGLTYIFNTSFYDENLCKKN